MAKNFTYSAIQAKRKAKQTVAAKLKAKRQKHWRT